MEGEEYELEILKDSLYDSYTYIRNYRIPNTRIGDIDGLLLGPKGIIILEIKNYQGELRISGSEMYHKENNDKYKLIGKNLFVKLISKKIFGKTFKPKRNIRCYYKTNSSACER